MSGATRRGVLFVALLRVAAAGAVEPPLVRWQDAGAHVGEVVTLTGEVARVTVEGETWTLEFAPDDPRAARVVVLVPLFERAPARPDRTYTGRQVRVSGRLQRFHGRPEMVVRGADRIAFAGAVEQPDADAGGSAGRPAAPVAPAPAAPASAPPPADVAPAVSPPDVAPTAPPPARGLVEAARRRVAANRACEAARARWREVAAGAADRADALARCAAAERFDCRAAAAALRPALAALDDAEAMVADACP